MVVVVVERERESICASAYALGQTPTLAKKASQIDYFCVLMLLLAVCYKEEEEEDEEDVQQTSASVLSHTVLQSLLFKIVHSYLA